MSDDLGDACEPISMIIRRCSIQLGIPASVLASLRPGPNGEPARCVVVPREPTLEMIAAGQDAHDDCVDNGFGSDADGNRYDYTTISPDAPARVYRAMLAAAQEPGHD